MAEQEKTDTKLTIFGGAGGKVALTNAKALQTALDNSAHDDPRGSEDGVFINFSGKRGVYEIGPDKENADADEIWLVNTASFESGWICWKGGRPVAKRMASIYGDPVSAPDMEEHGPFQADRGEGWSIAKSMILRSLDSGVQGIFTTNSKSGVSSLVGIQKEISERLGENMPSWAIIHLGSEEFMAQGNKNFKPVFPLFGWLGDAQINKLAEMEEIADGAIDDLCQDSEDGITSYDGELTDDFEEEREEAVASESAAEEKPKEKRRRKASATGKDAVAGRRRRAAV